MAEFSVPYTLVTPSGNITFNGTGDGLYLSDVVGLDGADIRNPVDDLPQHDGGLPHRFFRTARHVTLRGYIVATAGTTTRRTLSDTLRGYTGSLVRPTTAQLVASCRLRWTPSGYSDERMVDAIQLYEPVQISGGYQKEFEFTVVSPYSYAIDLTQTSTVIAAAGTATLTNAGNTASYPVIRVTGAVTNATVTNSTTGELVTLTAAGVAAGSYAEIDNFRKTVYLNGNSTNLLGKVDFTTSTWISLQPGANVIAPTGSGVTVLWNHSWV